MFWISSKSAWTTWPILSRMDKYGGMLTRQSPVAVWESWNALYLASNLVVTPLYLNYAKDPFIPVTLTLVSEIVQSTMPSKNKSMD